MDRRAALKKLAAGGAIALGGPMVLSSNVVASTGSGPPDPTSVVSYDPSGDGATFTVTGFPAGSTFQWRLNALVLGPKSKKQVDLVDGAGNLLFQSPLGQKVCGPCTSWTQSSSALGTVRLDRHKGLNPGDYFEIDLVATTPTNLTYEYRIITQYGSPPSVQLLGAP